MTILTLTTLTTFLASLLTVLTIFTITGNRFLQDNRKKRAVIHPFLPPARVLYVMCSCQFRIVTEKSSRNVLPVYGKGVPLHPQMRLIRSFGTGRADMRSLGARSLRDFHRQNL